mmetsp:Transcript_41332/g.36688  ORF Transcript_41332/g.36688 Transcript_41332/m.36688 type:complete len:337 (+) Transcript_41332:394-1404(+)
MADKNIPQYEQFAKQAVNYSKEHIFQRDVEITPISVSNKGAIQGVIYVNKKNFAHNLLEVGLAYAEALGKAEQVFYSEYKQHEKTAQTKNIGIWKAGIPIGSSSKSNSYKPIKDVRNVIVSEAYDPEKIYCQFPEESSTLSKVEKELSAFKSGEKIELPAKKGTPCVAKFTDGNWYRGVIEKVAGNEKTCTVKYIDYGNTDDVPTDFIYKAPPSLLTIKPLAHKCALAFVSSPLEGTNGYFEASDRVKELLFDKKISAHFFYEDATTKYFVAYDKKATGIKDSINYKIVAEGLGKVEDGIPTSADDLAYLREVEDDARSNRTGGWANNDFQEEEDY